MYFTTHVPDKPRENMGLRNIQIRAHSTADNSPPLCSVRMECSGFLLNLAPSGEVVCRIDEGDSGAEGYG